jgi:pyruvate-formate lyase-activating enzyme
VIEYKQMQLKERLKKHTLKGRVKAATRKVRELAVVGHALASTKHVVMAQIVPMRFCNLSCAYCNEYDKVSKPVPLEEMERRIDHLAALGSSIITISGGEPLTHPEMDGIIARIRHHGRVAGMITNGYLLMPERIERLNRAGLDHMQISIDNIEPDEISKKSLKVLDKKLEFLSRYAEFHVNINSVVGGGIRNPEDALVIGRRALDLGFTSTIGIIHDGDEEELFALQQVSGGDCQCGAERLAVPGWVTFPVCVRRRAGPLLLAATGISRCSAGAIHQS